MSKQELYQTVEAKKEEILTLSDKIWEYAELSMLEIKSTAAYVALLKQEGFRVEENLCGIPTAFSGTYGSGSPKIGILAEYDALSGLSQAPGVTEKQPLCEGGSGQGCGHNLLGAASLSAAIAIKDQIAAGKLHGTVVFYGCPGEEGCAGKTFMARDGLFRDLDAAITWHPGYTNEVTTGSNAACLQMVYEFAGIAAHAAGNPWEGRSALDGAELMNIGVQFLREHMEPKSSIHYSIADAGGISPNVVQPTAKLIYMVRAETVRKAKALLARVNDIAKGAALMTGTKMKYEITMAFSDYVPNRTLGAVVDQCMREMGAPEWTEDEYQLAAEFLRTYPRTTMVGIREKLGYYFEPEELDAALEKPLDRIIPPFNPKETAYSSGSTDVGDVGYATPTVMFHVATACLGNVGHSWQNTAFSCSDIGMKGMLRAAEIMTLAAIRTMDQPAVIAKAREELKQKNGGSYHCPLPDYVTPPIGRY